MKQLSLSFLAASLALLLAADHAAAQFGTPVQQNHQQTQQQPIAQGHVIGGPAAMAMNAHHSQRLRADLTLEQMQIPGFTFWGARISSMEPSSPLHAVGLRVGDVITRLDGNRVTQSRWWNASRGVWALPQLERHYGRTEVRNIRTGTTVVRNDFIDLGPRWKVPTPRGGGPLGPGVIVP